MGMKYTILLISGIPLIISFLAAIISSYVSLVYCKVEIDNLSHKLFENQVMYTKLLSQSVSWQLSNDLQKFPLYLRLISNYYVKILNGKVIFNLKHKNSLVHIEMIYSNQEDPELIRLFKKSTLLVNNWYHKNYSRIDQLSQEGQDLFKNVTRLTPLFRTIELERNLNNQQNSRFLQYNLAFLAFQLDGMMFSNTYNNTYQQIPNPQCGPGKFSTYDPRCRGWYKQAVNTFSIHFQQPVLSFTEKQSYLAQAICQRMKKHNETTNTDEIHNVLCFNVRLMALINYFQNYSNSTKQTYVIDPKSQVVVFDSSNRINGQQTQTLSSLELNYLQSKEEASKLNYTLLNQFQQSIKVRDLNKEQKNVIFEMQILNPYMRNGTKHYLLFNPVYVFDKIPQREGDYSYIQSAQEFNFTQSLNETLVHNKNNKKRNLEKKPLLINQVQSPGDKWQAQLAYLQINIITDEKLRDQSKQLNDFFKSYFIGVSIILVGVGVISIIIAVFYSFKIKETLLTPVQQLIDILNKIHEEKDICQIFSLIDENNNCIEDLFNSKETKDLYESLNEVFKVIKFSQENFYKENLTKTLLQLNDYLNFFKKFENNYVIGIAHNNIGCILLRQNHYYQALEHFSQSIIYARYEIHSFCMEHALNITSQILISYCFESLQNFNEISEKKQATSISINASNHAALDKNINIFDSIGQQNQRLTKQNCDQNQQINLNSISEENKIQSFENKLRNGSFFNKFRLRNTQRRFININTNESNQFYKKKIDLITTLYYRKKNYIITLMAFQDQMDQLICNNKLKKCFVYHNFWLEIKRLLKELLLIASELPIWESQQIEILLNISKCEFKLNKISKYQSIIQFCESLIQKLTYNQNCDKKDFSYDLKEINHSNVINQEESFGKSVSPVLKKQNANLEMVSNNQSSINPQINQNVNINYKLNEKNREYSNCQSQSKDNLINSIFIQPRNLQDKDNIFKLNENFKQVLQNKITNSINSLIKAQQPQTIQPFDQEETPQIQKYLYNKSRSTFNSQNKQRISLYQRSKKSTKVSLQSILKIDEQFRRTIRHINRDGLKVERLEQEIMINEEQQNKINQEDKIQFDFMYSQSVINLLKDITKSEFYIHNKQYTNACEILTSILENNKYILSHLPFIVIEQLSAIFLSKQIYSRELQSISNQFNKQLKFSITIIYADQRQDSQYYDSHQQKRDDSLQAFSNDQNSQIRLEQEIIESSLTQIFLLKSIAEQVLTEKDDNLSIIKANCNRIDEKIYITQIMEKIPSKQIEPVFQNIIERIVNSDTNSFILRRQSICNNIPTVSDSSIDFLQTSQIDKYNLSCFNDMSPIHSYSIKRYQNQSLNKVLLYNMNIRNPFLKTSNSQKDNNEVMNEENYFKNINLDLYRENIKELVEQQQQNNKISSHRQQQNTLYLDKILSLDIQNQQQHCESIRQEKQNSKGTTFQIEQFLQDHMEQLNNTYKFQQNQGDNTDLFRSISTVNSTQREDKNQKNLFNSLRNHQFHFSLRKALGNIIDPTCFQFQMQQNCFINSHCQQICEKQIFYQNQTSQLKKYIIYQTDEINIINNFLFQELCRLFIQFKIELIILSHKRGHNFLEDNSDLSNLKCYIKIFYSIEMLTSYLESQRNKFNEHLYPSYLQSF